MVTSCDALGLQERRGVADPTVHCGSDCRWERATCQNGHEDITQIIDFSDFPTARSTATFTTTVEVFDHEGDTAGDRVGGYPANFGAAGSSSHAVYIFARKFRANEWLVAAAVNAAEYGQVITYIDQPVPAADGLFPVAYYHVVFDATGAVSLVNGENVATAQTSLWLGISQLHGDVWGWTQGIDEPIGQFVDTGNFLRRGDGETSDHAPVEVQLDFSGLHETTYLNENGGTGGSYFRAYARAGVVAAGPQAGKDIAQTGMCTDDVFCRFAWNVDTSRYEAARTTANDLRRQWWDAQNAGKVALRTDIENNPDRYVRSDWETMRDVLAARTVPVNISLPAGDGRPTANTDACAAPTFSPSPLSFDEPDEVVLALDRSGSMDAEVGSFFSSSVTRLDFAKAAAKNFLGLQASRGANAPEIGVVWYNNELEIPVGSGGLLKLVNGTATDPVLEIGTTELADDLRENSHADGQNPEATGATGIGAALAESGSMFGDPTASVQAVLLLTDGQETMFPGSSALDPNVEAEALAARGIQIYTVPVGSDANRKSLSEMANASGGKMYDSRDETELPPMFMESYVRMRGQALAKHHLSEPVRTSTGGEFPTYYWSHEIEVEEGAGQLNVLLSASDREAAGYDPEYELIAPPAGGGWPSLRTERTDSLYRAITVFGPRAGIWTLRMKSGSDTDPPQSFVTVHIDNPGPDCTAQAETRVVRDGEFARIRAVVAYNTPIGEGANLTATIRRPDRSLVNVPFEYDSEDKGYLAKIDPSLYRGRGTYEVVVTCNVDGDAQLQEGESIFDDNDPLADRSVKPFRRQAATFFFVDSTQLPPLTVNPRFADDCDGDGILNADEPPSPTDTDGDGLPDICDGDADADDIPDGKDPDPMTPDLDVGTVLVKACVPGPAPYDARRPTVDSGVQLDGAVVSRNGAPLSPPIGIQGSTATLNPGEYEVEWKATRQDGRVVVYTRRLSIESGEAADCCAQGQEQIIGHDYADFIAPWFEKPYCVITKGGADFVVTRNQSDSVWGGDGSDFLVSNAGSDIVIGGAGDDFIAGGRHGTFTANGGDGADYIVSHFSNSAALSGGPGADFIMGGHGNDVIRPGAGADYVDASYGDDTVIIHDACELAHGEFLYGGPGTDTLVSPFTRLELAGMGVITISFEKVVVDTALGYLAECP